MYFQNCIELVNKYSGKKIVGFKEGPGGYKEVDFSDGNYCSGYFNYVDLVDSICRGKICYILDLRELIRDYDVCKKELSTLKRIIKMMKNPKKIEETEKSIYEHQKELEKYTNKIENCIGKPVIDRKWGNYLATYKGNDWKDKILYEY